MLTCKEVSKLASESLDRKLSWRERLGMRLHLLRCDLCSRYLRQLRFMRDATTKMEGQGNQTQAGGLSEEARDRIRRKLEQSR